MGFKLQYDEERKVLASIGDWPNGILVMEFPADEGPTFAIDWHLEPLEKINSLAEDEIQKLGAGNWAEIEMDKKNSEPVDLLTVVRGCEGLTEALGIWGTACAMVDLVLKRVTTDPGYFDDFIKAANFLYQLNQALAEEAENR